MFAPIAFLIVAGISLLFLASCTIWCRAIVRRVHGETVLPWNPAVRCSRLFAGVAVSVVVWYGTIFLFAGASVAPADESPEPAANSAAEAREPKTDTPPTSPPQDEDRDPADEREKTRRAVITSSVAGLTATCVILLLLPQFSIEPRQLRDFGISLQGLKTQLQDGLWGFGACAAPVMIVLTATFWLRTPEDQHPLLQLLTAEPSIATVLIITLAAVVVAPLIEELIFRVVIQGWLQTKLPPAFAIGIVSVLFAGVHKFPDLLPLLPLAAVLGIVYYRRYSYIAVVLIHMLFNATNLLLALLTTRLTDEIPADDLAAWLGALLL